MPWKMDGENIVLENGNPVWVYADGKEAPLDGGHLTQKITELTGEAASRRRELRAAEEKLKAFEGIEDAEAAKKALETVKDLDAKKLIDAGDAEKVRLEIQKGYEAKLKEKDDLIAEKDATLNKELIGGRFSRSKYIADNLTIPVDVAQSFFGQAFKIEDGKVVAYDHSGNKIFSRERPGEPAEFDEALSVLVGNYAHKDAILRATQTGSGAAGGGSTRTGGGPKSYAECKTDAERIAYLENDANLKR